MARTPRRFGNNPYGTLGPSPGRVSRITPRSRSVTSPSPPVAPRPVGPSLPSDAEVWARVNALYNPMVADVQRAWQAQQAASQNRLAAIGGLGGAWSGLLRQMVPRAAEGFTHAATVAPQIGAAGGSAAAGRVGASIAENAALAQSLAPAAPSEAPVNAQALGGVLTGLGGTIPGREFQGIGEGVRKGAEADVKQAEVTTQYDITEEVMKAAQVDAGYTQQLIDLAKQRPEMYFQVLDELRSVAREADKMAFEREQFAFDRKRANREWADTQADNRLQRDAFNLQKRELGYDVASDKADRAYDWANLRFKTQKQAQDAQRAAAKAAQQGRQIDASASKVIGYIVDKEGRPILQGGKRIPVAPPAGQKVKAVTNRSKAVSKVRSGAFDYGKTLMKESVVKAGERIGPDYKGKYIARKGVKGVFPDGSTNRLNLAARSVTFAQAMEQAWAAVDGDNLVSVYGMSPAEVRKQIRQALIRAGWKPDGVRP